MKKKLHFLLSLMVLTMLAGSAKAQDAIYSWDFQGYGSTVWLPVDATAEGIVIFEDRTVYPATGEKFAGIYAEADKIRVDKNSGIRAYTKGGIDVIGIPGLKKGDVVEVVCNAGGGTGTDQVIQNVTDNATLTVNAWNEFSITMNEDGNLGIEPIFYNTNGNWYSIATINVTHPEAAPQLLANPSFELSALDTPLAEEIIVKNEAPIIYGWTLEGVGTQYSNTEVRKADSETVSTSQFGTSNPSDGEYSLFYRNGWNADGTTVTITSDAIAELPAGDYLLSVDYKQRYAYDEDKQKNENTHVAIALNNDEEVVASAVSEAAGGDKGGNANTYFNDTEWSTLSLPFSLDASLEGSQVVITLNAAGARRSDFYIDNVQLVKVPGIEIALPVLDKAIKAAQAEVAKYIVGDGPFQYAETEISPLTEAIATAQAAYDSAESKDAVTAATEALNAVLEAFAPVQNAPEADKAYTLALTTSEGTFYLNMSEGIKIAEEATPIYFVPQDGGKYAISNGEEYINYEGSNSWTMTASANPYAWTVVAVENGITLIGNNSRYLGTNTSDGNGAGAPCYGDKQASNGNYIWTIVTDEGDEEEEPKEEIEITEKPVPAFSPLADDGETVQYLYNVESGAFLLGANDWNTRASISDTKGYQFKVAKNEDGETWTLNDYVENQSAWKAVFAGGAADIWVDNLAGANVNGWVITELGDNKYQISNPAAANGYLAAAASFYDTRVYLTESDYLGSTWAFVNEDDYVSYIAEYTEWTKTVVPVLKTATEPGTDITPAIGTIAASMEGWTITNESTFHINTWSWEGITDGSWMTPSFLENWKAKDDGNPLPEGTISYTLSGLVPSQEYVVSALIRAYNEGSETAPTGAYFFAGDAQSEDISTGTNATVDGKALVYGVFSVTAAADADGNLTIGLVEKDNNFNWIVMRDIKVVVAKEEESTPEIAFKNTPLTQDMFKGWDGVGADASIVSNYPYWDAAELGTTLEGGGVVYGNSNVSKTEYADISDADVLRIEGTPGLVLRVLINRQMDESLTEINPTISENGYVDVDLTSYEYVHLNSIKVQWGATGAVTALTLNPIEDEPELAVYEGFLAENGLFQAQNMDMGNSTEAQTVTIADTADGMVNITFSGINYVGAMMPITIPEFTIENVAVVENEDGSVSYSCEEVVVAVPMGNMTSNYVGTLTGTKADADATPVITLVIANAVKLTAVFAATAEEAEAALEGVLAGDTPTSIDSIATDAVKSNAKFLENGKVVIIRNGVKYDINGTVIK